MPYTTDKARILAMLHQVYHGQPWYGDPFKPKLDKIDWEIAKVIPPITGKSIAHYVAHLIAWREFVIQKLIGNHAFDLKINTKEDWPDVDISSPADWDELLVKLEMTQQYLLDAIEKLPDERMTQPVKGRKYQYIDLLEGIIQHDIYHLGQIALLARMIKGE